MLQFNIFSFFLLHSKKYCYISLHYLTCYIYCTCYIAQSILTCYTLSTCYILQNIVTYHYMILHVTYYYTCYILQNIVTYHYMILHVIYYLLVTFYRILLHIITWTYMLYIIYLLHSTEYCYISLHDLTCYILCTCYILQNIVTYHYMILHVTYYLLVTASPEHDMLDDCFLVTSSVLFTKLVYFLNSLVVYWQWVWQISTRPCREPGREVGMVIEN